METKTISCLNTKIWYRFLKVIYIFSLLFCIGASIIFLIDGFDSGYITLSLLRFILFPLFIYIGFEIIKRAFYYIILGTIKPSDDNYFGELKKYKVAIIIIFIILIVFFSYGLWEAHKVDQIKARLPRGFPDLPPLPSLPSLPKLPKLHKLPSLPSLPSPAIKF